MKLRTRLFLSFSALMTVALLGLLLALSSVMQMARTQERLVRDNFTALERGAKLRQRFGDQIVILLSENPDMQAMAQAQEEFVALLDEALRETRDPRKLELYRQVATHYKALRKWLSQPTRSRRLMLNDNQFSEDLNAVRLRLIETQQHTIDSVISEEGRSRERAILLASLLGIVGFAVLVIGFVTAHSFARRFGAPIEKLSQAADQIGQGDFQVSLPISPIAELATLIRRFGLMAEALRLFKATNVEALLNGQRRLQAVLDSIDDGLLIIDRRGRLEHANPVAQRQLAWETEQIGRAIGEALDYPELDTIVQQVLRNQPLESAAADLQVRADGETRLLAWRLSPVSHTDGRVLGAVMVMRDVTEQRAFERVRNEFVLRASHELRTPVTGMHMAFGLLRERLDFPADARENDLLHTIDEEMRRMVRLVNDLLNFSRYQSGKQKLELAPCDIAELLELSRQRFINQAAEQDIDLQVEVQAPLPLLNLDRLLMERVLDNLLNNALRHTPKGGQIRLLARRHGDRAILSVEDSGEGIPYSQQARIFEPFVQIGRKRGGSGLGLALCKEIAQLHGGRLGVHSRLGHGTIFYVALPI